MLLSKVTGTSNSVVQERYITISVVKKNIAEARAYFSRVGTDLLTHLAQLSSIGQELDLVTRLRIFRDFFKGAEPPAFEFDLKTQMQTRPQLQGLALPGLHGVPSGSLQAERSLGSGTLPARICQLHQGQHGVRALRVGS